MKIKQLFVFFLSVAALSAGIYIGYRVFIFEPPEPAEDDEEVEETAPEPEEPSDSRDEDITLPTELRERIDERRAERDRLYERATAAHRQGNLNEAESLYRQTVALSPRDMTAARSYRFLGDIFSEREQYSRALQFYEYSLELAEEEPIFHYRIGRVYEQLDRESEVETALTRAIDLEERADFYLARGNFYFDNGSYEQAVDDYSRGVELQARPDIYLNLGLAYKQLGMDQSAIETFEKLLKLDLSDQKRYEVAMNLGRLYLDQDHPRDALSRFDEARQLNPTAAAFYNLGQARIEIEDFAGAADAINQAAQLEPDNYPLYVDLGYVYEQMEEYQRSIAAYRKALQIEPESTAILYALGRLYELIDQPVQALDYYRQLIDIEEGPRLGAVYRRMGEIFLDQNENRQAATAFRNASLLAPDDHEINYNLGIAYFRSERGEDAIAEFKNALAGETDSIKYRLALAETLFLTGYRDQSLEQFKLILEQEPEHYEAAYMIGYIHYSRGETEQARRSYQKLADMTSDDDRLVDVYQNIGNIYLLEEKYPEARVSYRQAIEISASPGLYYNLGLAYIYEEEWEKAAASLQKAAEDLGDDSRVRAALGFVFFQLGIYEQAQEELERAIELNPENTRAHYDLQRVKKSLEDEET
ncbi:MAG: tetratricopeptide repeat protein [bacterium]